MNNYYIYAYLRKDGTPYYIGKGKGNRLLNEKGHNVRIPKDSRFIVIMESNLTEIGALALERRYIDWYGRKDIGTGILRNLTDGGEGTSGWSPTKQTRNKIGKANSGKRRTQEMKDKMKGRGSWNKGLTKNEHPSIMKCSKVNVGRVREDLSKLNKEIKSSDWLITFPDNHTEIITNLKEFSHTHNLSYGCMWQVANKKCGRTQHKGYKVIKV